MDICVTGFLQAPSDQPGTTTGIEYASLPIGYQCFESATGLGVSYVAQFIDQIVIVSRRPVVEQLLLVARVVVDATEPRIERVVVDATEPRIEFV